MYILYKMYNYFYGLVYALGLRKNVLVVKENITFYDIARRVISRGCELDIDTQPRQVTRMLFQRRGNQLSPFIKPKRKRRIIINNEIQNDEAPQEVSLFNYAKELCMNWWYTALISMILCVQPIYTLVIIASNDTSQDIPYIATLFFQLIPPLQYYHAICYFQTDHFEDFYFSQSKIGILNRITGIIILLTVTNVIINIVRLLYLDYDIEFADYQSYSQLSRGFIFITLLVSWIYGNLILFTNLFCFCLVFTKHKKIIRLFAKKILDDDCPLSLNEITVDLFKIIYNLKKSITNFERLFSSFTFLGAISFGIFLSRIRDGNFLYFPWNIFITYIIMQIVFFWVILKMNGCRNTLSDFITHPKYAKKYIRRYDVEQIKTHFPTEDEHFLLLVNMEEELGGISDWRLLDSLLDKDWTEFKFFGINIADFELIKRGMALIALILGINALLNGEKIS